MDAQTRRNFLNRTSMGLGALATASIAQDSDLLARGLQTKPGTGLHFPAKAKRVIYLHMSAGLLIWTLLTTSPKCRSIMASPYLSRSLENND